MILPKDRALISAKESEHYFVHLYQKAKTPDYYHKTRRGLGYLCMPVLSDSESDEEVYCDSSSATSSWDSNVSVGGIFESLLVNMISTKHLEDDGEDTFKSEELTQSDFNPWIKHRNTLWDVRFTRSTEDKVIQINLENETNPKAIFISESLLLSGKEDLIHLIWEYKDIFTWNYEDMPGLDPQIAMHYLNINPNTKPVKQQ